MRLAPLSCMLGLVLLAGCDPDTSPIPGTSSDSGTEAAAGSGGSAGTGGSAGGSGGTAGTAGEAGQGGADTDAGGAAGTPGDSGDEPLEEAGDDAAGAGGSSGSTGYSHTIKIDGTNDFDPAKEKFASSSMTPDPYNGYVSWNDKFLYIGMDGKSIADKSEFDWVLVYIGGTPGTKTGLPYASQQPSLPFESKYHVRWKANGQYTNAQKWTGTAWVDANFTPTQASNGTYVEIAIDRLDIDFPGKVQVVFSMLRELTGMEWTWAGVPSTSITDGKNASYTKYFEFDFSSTAAPNEAKALP